MGGPVRCTTVAPRCRGGPSGLSLSFPCPFSLALLIPSCVSVPIPAYYFFPSFLLVVLAFPRLPRLCCRLQFFYEVARLCCAPLYANIKFPGSLSTICPGVLIFFPRYPCSSPPRGGSTVAIRCRGSPPRRDTVALCGRNGPWGGPMRCDTVALRCRDGPQCRSSSSLLVFQYLFFFCCYIFPSYFRVFVDVRFQECKVPSFFSPRLAFGKTMFSKLSKG